MRFIGKKSISVILVRLMLISMVGFWMLSCSLPKTHLQSSPESFAFSWDTGTFAEYVDYTKQYVSRNRVYLDERKQSRELAANAPFELKPAPSGSVKANQPKRGILLIHGLSDAPYSMRDLAHSLSQHGFMVRVILLPGHGTRPGDSVGMKAQQWYRAAEFGLKSLKKDVDKVYLGGFSTGANISMTLALRDSNIDGLALFSPAFKLKWEYPTALATLDLFMDWLSDNPIEDYSKYSSFSINSLQQFYITSDRVQKEMDKGKRSSIPVFMALSENDSVVNVNYVKQVFNRNLSNPGNRMIYFRNTQVIDKSIQDSRIVVRESYLPQKRILNMSHMAIPNRSINQHYGASADYRCCVMNTSGFGYNTCVSAKKDELWFASWGTTGDDKTIARLTYNPYFDEMVGLMIDTLVGQ